jgi:hypothetical protein
MSRAITAQELSMRTSIPAILPTRHDVPNIPISPSQPRKPGLAGAVRFGKVVGGGEEPTGRDFVGGGNQHANAIDLHLRVLSSGIIC